MADLMYSVKGREGRRGNGGLGVRGGGGGGGEGGAVGEGRREKKMLGVEEVCLFGWLDA